MKSQKLVVSIYAAAALLVVALSLVLANGLTERVVTVGDRAPSFTLRTDHGREISTKEFGGKILVVNFWATWCPPCVEEMPSLNEMSARLAAKGVVVVGVSVDRNETSYRRFIEQAGIRFETARDPAANISADYGTFKYPETYVIDAQGRVRQKHIGPRNWMDPEILQSIEALL
jgi:peroxiredoxin